MVTPSIILAFGHHKIGVTYCVLGTKPWYMHINTGEGRNVLVCDYNNATDIFKDNPNCNESEMYHISFYNGAYDIGCVYF